MAFDGRGGRMVTAASQLAQVSEARNRKHSGLITWLLAANGGSENHGSAYDAVLASFFTVVELWRVRGVCRAFRRWATTRLESLPRVVAVGGSVLDVNAEPVPRVVATAGVEMLSFATLKWSSRADIIPPLPDPRAFQDVACSYEDGRVVVGGGWNVGLDPPLPHLLRSMLQWAPGSGNNWTALPDFSVERRGAASISLPDGALMVVGGWCADEGRAVDRSLDQVLEAPQIEVLYHHEGKAATRWVAVKPDATAPPPEPEPEPASKTKQKQKVREPSPKPEPEAVVGSCGQPKKPERRRFPTAVRLRTGKVLLAGGRTGASTGSATDTCELWDPQFKIWTELPPMAVPREDNFRRPPCKTLQCVSVCSDCACESTLVLVLQDRKQQGVCCQAGAWPSWEVSRRASHTW